MTLARDAAPAFNSPAHSAPTCAPQPAIAPKPQTTAAAAPRSNVAALARDSAPKFNDERFSTDPRVHA